MKPLSCLLFATLLPLAALAKTEPAGDPAPSRCWTDFHSISSDRSAVLNFQSLSTCRPAELVMLDVADFPTGNQPPADVPDAPAQVTSVPEASTMVMILAGLAFMLFSLRRSKTE